MAAVLQTEVFLPKEDSGRMEMKSQGSCDSLQSPFTIVASQNHAFEGESVISPVASKISGRGSLLEFVLEDIQEESETSERSKVNMNDLKKEDLQPEEWDEIGQELKNKHRRDFSFGITHARPMSGDLEDESTSKPTEQIDLMLPQRNQSYRDKAPSQLSLDVSPFISQAPASAIHNADDCPNRAITPTPPPTPETEKSPGFKTQTATTSSATSPFDKLFHDAPKQQINQIFSTQNNNNNFEKQPEAMSLQELITNCKKFGNQLVMELCNHPKTSEVVSNAKKELGDVCMLLLQSLGLTETIIKEQQSSKDKKQQEQNMAWQAEFWKVKYKEVAEKYNKVYLAYKAQQQQQESQSQKPPATINVNAQPWVPPSQVVSAQNRVVSSNVQMNFGGNVGVEEASPRSAIGLESGEKLLVPPDSAILSIDGVPTGSSQPTTGQPVIVRNVIPRPKMTQADDFEPVGYKHQPSRDEQLTKIQNNNKSRGGSKRGKQSPRSKKNQQDQQPSKKQSQSNNNNNKSPTQGVGKASSSDKQAIQQGRDEPQSRPYQRNRNTRNRGGRPQNNNKSTQNNNNKQTKENGANNEQSTSQKQQNSPLKNGENGFQTEGVKKTKQSQMGNDSDNIQ
eukprot:TRINITY_DN2990_c0_g4_i1.p1 TRINITY_DN2990_c0_g4~~TRINITY_DN2990_c0_g4_i1.p1  ORF type:complete len:622 (-),score=89.49 TRINITY_DN2990_c0_g4_i1:312-2177(-)